MAPSATLETMWQAGRARWPGVELTLEAYSRHLASLVDEVDDTLHGEDLYLAAAAAAGDRAALALFDSELLAGIGRHLSRIDATAQFADEVRQALRERLLLADGETPPRIARYSGQGPLGGWVRVAALRVALNLRRGKVEPRPLDEVLELAAGAHSPELQLVVARSRAAVEEAVRAAFAGLAQEDRALLRLHLLEDLSIDALAELQKIHRSTAARRIAAARQAIVDATLARLQGTLQLSPSDLQSLLGLVRSRLELSLNELLATIG